MPKMASLRPSHQTPNQSLLPNLISVNLTQKCALMVSEEFPDLCQRGHLLHGPSPSPSGRGDNLHDKNCSLSHLT